MDKKYILITGSDGLVGSECVDFFIKKGYSIIGIDNNYRKKFFWKRCLCSMEQRKTKKFVQKLLPF